MIPIIDLSDPDEHKLVRIVAGAGRVWGIFQVVNHGIPAAVVSDMQAAGAAFFTLPQAEKEAYAGPPRSSSIEGYGSGLRGGWGEHLFHRAWPAERVDPRFLPRDPPGYRGSAEGYARAVRSVGHAVLRLLSLGLGLEAHTLKEALGGDRIEGLLKINYYPPCHTESSEQGPVLGVLAHTDLSALTVLVPNQVPGLQVLRDDNDRWIDVDYIPNALIIHVGDQIEVASNGFYKSVVHRSIVDKERTRMSWPVFFEPPVDFVVGPIPELISDENPSKYDPKMFKDFANNKLNRPLSH